MEKIKLPDEDVNYLNAFVKKGKKSARELTRAHILLLVNKGRTENEIKEILGISRATVSNVKKRFREEGLQSALTEKSRPGQPKKYTERQEAEIIAQACTELDCTPVSGQVVKHHYLKLTSPQILSAVNILSSNGVFFHCRHSR